MPHRWGEDNVNMAFPLVLRDFAKYSDPNVDAWGIWREE